MNGFTCGSEARADRARARVGICIPKTCGGVRGMPAEPQTHQILVYASHTIGDSSLLLVADIQTVFLKRYIDVDRVTSDPHPIYQFFSICDSFFQKNKENEKYND